MTLSVLNSGELINLYMTLNITMVSASDASSVTVRFNASRSAMLLPRIAQMEKMSIQGSTYSLNLDK